MGSSSQNGKKSNVVPLFKKKTISKSWHYRSISLRPVSGKIFARLLYDSMFKFLTENNLVSQNQSGFKPGYSCTNQLLSITHEIYKSFNDGCEVRSAFLDMSKAFDNVWHKGRIFKLKQNDISGNLTTDYLKLIKQGDVEWPTVFMVQHWNKNTTKIYPWLILVFNLYKRSFRRSHNKYQARCRQCFTFFGSLVANNINLSVANLNNDLSKINAWALNYKIIYLELH